MNDTGAVEVEVDLDPELNMFVHTVAEQQGVPASAVIESAVRQYVQRHSAGAVNGGE